MILLLDLDSILYHSVYRVVSFNQMRHAINQLGKEDAKEWLKSEVYNEGVYRTEKKIDEIRTYLDNNFFEPIEKVELFITTCKNNFRNDIEPSYKANRKRNKYVWILRGHYEINGAYHSDVYEADDLIAERAKALKDGTFIVASIDKDLKQIGGYYWSYYEQKKKDEDGNFILNEYGNPEKEYKQKDIAYIAEEKASFLFWKQMLMGDNSDNIKGLHRVGEKTAEKLLKDVHCYFIKVAREYLKRDMKEQFRNNYKLLKLGIPQLD